MNPVKRVILIVAGYLFVALGAIGIALPVLPTTPFLILAAICFSSSSPKAREWLENNRLFGEYIENYRTGAGVSRSKKIYAIIFLWVMLMISGYFMRNNMIVLIILLIVGIAVTAHISLLKGRKMAAINTTDPECE